MKVHLCEECGAEMVDGEYKGICGVCGSTKIIEFEKEEIAGNFRLWILIILSFFVVIAPLIFLFCLNK